MLENPLLITLVMIKLVIYKYLECVAHRFAPDSWLHDKIQQEAQWLEFTFLNNEDLIKDPEKALWTAAKLRQVARSNFTPDAHSGLLDVLAERIAYQHNSAVRFYSNKCDNQ